MDKDKLNKILNKDGTVGTIGKPIIGVAFQEIKDRLLKDHSTFTEEDILVVSGDTTPYGETFVANIDTFPIQVLDRLHFDDKKVSNNQKKRCNKGLHNYRAKEVKDGSIATTMWVCDCGEVQKHFRK